MNAWTLSVAITALRAVQQISAVMVFVEPVNPDVGGAAEVPLGPPIVALDA